MPTLRPTPPPCLPLAPLSFLPTPSHMPLTLWPCWLPVASLPPGLCSSHGQTACVPAAVFSLSCVPSSRRPLPDVLKPQAHLCTCPPAHLPRLSPPCAMPTCHSLLAFLSTLDPGCRRAGPRPAHARIAPRHVVEWMELCLGLGGGSGQALLEAVSRGPGDIHRVTDPLLVASGPLTTVAVAPVFGATWEYSLPPPGTPQVGGALTGCAPGGR